MLMYLAKHHPRFLFSFLLKFFYIILGFSLCLFIEGGFVFSRVSVYLLLFSIEIVLRYYEIPDYCFINSSEFELSYVSVSTFY